MSGKSNSASAARRTSARRRSEASAVGLDVRERLRSASSTRVFTVSVGVRATAADAVRPRSSAAVMVVRVRRMLPPGSRELPELAYSTSVAHGYSELTVLHFSYRWGTIAAMNRTLAAASRGSRALVVVDLGGTWVRVSVSGGAPRAYRGPTPGVAGLPALLARLWRRWRLSRGYLAALGAVPRVLLLAGTGSIALGRDVRGRFTREGGLGPLLGDDGSAFSIGRAWLRSAAVPAARARRVATAPDAVARVAALAPAVLRRARRGDRTARRVVREAQQALATLAGRTARALRL